MRTLPSAVVDAMEDGRNFTASATIIFTAENWADITSQRISLWNESGIQVNSSSRTIKLSSSAIAVGDNSMSDGAGVTGVPLGVAVCRCFTLSLLNDEDQFTGVNFYGCEVSLFASIEVDGTGAASSAAVAGRAVAGRAVAGGGGAGGTTYEIPLGTFYVCEDATYGDIVTINANDAMTFADKPFSLAMQTQSDTIGGLFRSICSACGLNASASAFTNSNLVINGYPTSDYSYRDVLGFIAMLAGGNCHITDNSTCEIIPIRIPARTADMDLPLWINVETSVVDVVITGLSATVDDTETDENGNTQQVKRTVTVGDEGYVLNVENPLLTPANASELLTSVFNVIGTSPFRIFSGDYLAEPRIQFGDTVKITDRRGNVYNSFVTDVTFAFGGNTSVANSAESVSVQQSKYTSPAQKAVIAVRKEVTALQDYVARKIANASGMKLSTVEQDDGSLMYYLHNGESVDTSTAIMQFNSAGLSLSTDGGKTYPYAFTVDGDLIANILEATNVSAGWINTGSLVVKDADGIITFSANCDTGEVFLNGRYVKVGTYSVADVKEIADGAGDKANAAQISANNAAEAAKTAQDGVNSINENGVDKVTTSMGYTFNNDGLHIKRGGGIMENVLDDTGMYVKRDGQTVLRANKDGVEAIDITVRNYLIVGDNSRFENYGANRTGCFYIGG